jgi:tetratricopeptide (TPR) repeat protein
VLKRNDKLAALERLGIAYREAGEPAKAIEPLEKALQLEPRRRVVLETLVAAAKTAGDDDAVVRHTQALLAVTEDREKKRELLEHVATIHHERRKDPQRAIAAYMAALDMWPEERSIMIRLLELLTETKQWKQSVQLLGRLAELTEPESRAPYWVAAGNILSEELNAVPEAIDAFERAMDADPSDFKTFERIDKLVTATHDWKAQERIYRRQIKRMGQDVAPDKRPVLLALWHGLGEIYRSRLKDCPAAVAAFEVAVSMDPESVERHKILAELYRPVRPRHLRQGDRRAPRADPEGDDAGGDGRRDEDDVAPVRRDGRARRGARGGVGAGADEPGRPRRGVAVPAVPAARRRARARAAERGAVAAAALPPRRGPHAVAAAGDAGAVGVGGAREVAQGPGLKRRPAEERAHRSGGGLQGVRVRHPGVSGWRRPTSTWRPRRR